MLVMFVTAVVHCVGNLTNFMHFIQWARKAEATEKDLKTEKKLHEKAPSDRKQQQHSLFSLASVPLINSWLSSVTNVSLPSSSPGEEGGVFNVQFVLWIDVCWHRLSPLPAPCVIHRTITKRFLRAFPAHIIQRNCPRDWLTRVDQRMWHWWTKTDGERRRFAPRRRRKKKKKVKKPGFEHLFPLQNDSRAGFLFIVRETELLREPK